MNKISTHDWKRIELEDHAGLLTLRKIGTQRGLTHRAVNQCAKRDSGQRDLNATIPQRATELPSAPPVSIKESNASLINESPTIEVAASAIREIKLCDQGTSRCGVDLGVQLMGELEDPAISDSKALCPLDNENRQFQVDRPNQLWVSDFTYVSIWQGWLYVAFIADLFAPRIVGWRVSSSMTTDFVLDALAQALYARQPAPDNSLVHHSDRGPGQPSAQPWRPASAAVPARNIRGATIDCVTRLHRHARRIVIRRRQSP